MTRIVFVLLGLSFLVSNGAGAQVGKDSQLYRDIMAMDSVLFYQGFDRCNLAALGELVAPDLEFYHDQGGYQDKDAFMQAMRENICSTPERKPIRRIVEGSVDVFPLYSNGNLYGAIQDGEHEFYIDEPGKDLYATSVARFTSLWLIADESWQLSHAYSFDHRDP